MAVLFTLNREIMFCKELFYTAYGNIRYVNKVMHSFFLLCFCIIAGIIHGTLSGKYREGHCKTYMYE